VIAREPGPAAWARAELACSEGKAGPLTSPLASASRKAETPQSSGTRHQPQGLFVLASIGPSFERRLAGCAVDITARRCLQGTSSQARDRSGVQRLAGAAVAWKGGGFGGWRIPNLPDERCVTAATQAQIQGHPIPDT